MGLVSSLIQELERRDMMECVSIESNSFKSVYLPLYQAGEIQQSLYFTPDTMLNGDNCTIHSIEVVDILTNGTFSDNGQDRDNMAVSVLKSGYIVFSDRERQEFAQVPLVQMVSRLNKGRKFLCKFDEHQWDNCYIEFGSVVGLSSAVGIQLVVNYTPKNK